MEISSIVSVQVTRQTKTISQAGFGVCLILTPVASLPAARVSFYTSIDGVSDDFESSTDAYKSAAAIFSQNPRPEKIAIGRYLSTETIDDVLPLIKDETNDWYALVLTSRTQADQAFAAAWIETQDKILFVRSNNADIKDPADDTDICSVLSAATRERTATIAHFPATDDFIDAGWLGGMLPKQPGSATFAFKTVSGATPDKFTASEQAAIDAKKANHYQTVGGVNIMQPGKMASGEWIDVIIGIDWLKARIAERIFSVLANRDKVPYTDAGAATLENEIRAQLTEGVKVGLLAADPAFTVTVPKVSTISVNDRASRVFPSITFEATLAGAIHKTTIQGTVSV
jgi:hypothetical protein